MVRSAFASATCLLAVGCADPCFDDGLDQGGCPTAETESSTDSNSNTDSMSDSQSASMSASATAVSDSMTGATDTATQTESMSESMSESASETESESNSATETAGECPELMELLVPETPTFQIVVDQSGSMDQDFGGPTRWEALETTLVDPDEGIVTNLQSSVRFGLSLYHNDQSGGCPEINEIAPQLDARDELITLLGPETPGGDTPTGESIEAVLPTLMQDEWDGPKFLLLATDGEPDTCDVPDPQNMMEMNMARNVARDAVTAAFDAGVPTFVISVGDDVAADHLQELANAGQGVGMGDPDEPFYVALDQADLIAAFDEIIAGLRSCELELPTELKPALAPSCDVTVNGEGFPYDDPNGWERTDAMHIELLGDACSAIQEGLVVIEMNCVCEEA